MIITVASGKGGVGKSNFVANLGLCLSDFGVNTAIVDCNLTNGDLSCIMGPPLPKKTIHDVFLNNVHINEVVFKHPSGVKMIGSSLSVNDASAVHPRSISQLATKLSSIADVVLIDAPGTLGENAVESMKIADRIILITTPEIISFSNVLKTKKIAEKNGVEIWGTVINKLRRNKKMVRKLAREWLTSNILCALPFDENVTRSLEYGRPIVRYKPNSPYSIEMKKFAAKIANVRMKRRRKKNKH